MTDHEWGDIPSTRDLQAKSGLLALKSMVKAPGCPLEGLHTIHTSLGHDIFRLQIPKFSTVIVASPENAKRLLVTDAVSFTTRMETDPVTKLFGDGLLVLDDHRHAEVKSLLMQATPESKLEYFLQETEPSLDGTIQSWIRSQTINVNSAVRKYAWETLENVYFNHQLSEEEKRTYFPLLMQAVHYIGPGWWLLSGKSSLPKSLLRLRHHLETLAQQAVKAPSAPVKAIDFLSQSLTDAYGESFVTDQFMTLLIAGHDTVTSLLAWSIALLAKFPEWQKRIRKEICNEMGDSLANVRTANQLHFLDQFIKEVLRLYPPIHSGIRTKRCPRTQESTQSLQERVMLSYYLLHRHESYWERPLEFDPMRWHEHFRPTPYTYLPFGAGKRFCPGATFAKLQVKWMLARLLQQASIQANRHIPRQKMRAALEPQRFVVEVFPI
ncbi:cytochrome P450 [Alicyclobacillus tolerans]|uniref:Cytochrome P450 n=1 Tax=Alicyclobacillus tolerans TaxID=90970 RepID=A0ABT9LYX1_9BACL|nr:cytochrome P450 [Alicyclobacillus tengchongensis]MDP9729453.1 cytochrome P450 [Alicyclobacillus tengchongensis]